jgi:hypothetical protein
LRGAAFPDIVPLTVDAGREGGNEEI